MRCALEAKNKLAFIDGSIRVPELKDLNLQYICYNTRHYLRDEKTLALAVL